MLLSAREAADRLGIKLDSLYAYVSRGRLRSHAVPGSRERHYDSTEIDTFAATRGGGVPAAEPEALPRLNSSICLIEDGRLYYRGRDAVRLSDTATLEEVARLLWGEAAPHPDPLPAGGEREQDAAAETPRPVYGEREGPIAQRGEGEGQPALIERCQARLAALSADDPNAGEATPAEVRRIGHTILAALAAALGAGPGGGPLHRRLAAAWRLDATGADIVRRILVLLADHELNASTFAARIVASTGASPYMAVSAALGALSGRRHGGAALRCEALFHDARAGGADPIDAVAERLLRGEALPGIGQPLYPDGDPRAVAILYALSLVAPQARRLVGRQPNVDFALGAASAALALPRGSALVLFVLARTVGWIAHAIEQYQSGVLIRPRARYTGQRPTG